MNTKQLNIFTGWGINDITSGNSESSDQGVILFPETRKNLLGQYIWVKTEFRELIKSSEKPIYLYTHSNYLVEVINSLLLMNQIDKTDPNGIPFNTITAWEVSITGLHEDILNYTDKLISTTSINSANAMLHQEIGRLKSIATFYSV